MRISAVELVPFHVLPYSPGTTPGAPAAALPFYRAFVDELPEALDAIVAAADLQGVADVGGGVVGLGEALPRAIDRLRDDRRLPGRGRTAGILGGDLHNRADEDDVSPAWLAMANVCRWVAGVAGNHDRFGPPGSEAVAVGMLSRTNAFVLDGSTVTLDGLRVGGLSGIVNPASGARLRREEAFVAALSAVVQRDCDVLVLHDGPNVGGTRLPGWPSLRRVLEAAPPMLVIRGHDHWEEPVAELRNGTQVLNVEGRVVVLQRRTGGAKGGT